MLERFPPDTRERHDRLSTGIRMRSFERGSGKTVVFLHGFPDLALTWSAQFEACPPGYRFVAPDMRGFGGTDAPQGVASYRIDALVADVVSLFDALGASRVHLVGHDWGSIVAWEVARRHPDRLWSLSSLNCPPLDVMWRSFVRHPMQIVRSWYVFFFQLPRLPERAFARDADGIVLRAFRSNAVHQDGIDATTVAPIAASLRANPKPINYYRAAFRGGPPAISSEVIVPVLVVFGTRDRAIGPWFAERSAYDEAAEDLTLVRVEDAGHWVHREAPAVVNRSLLAHFGRAEGAT